MSASDVIERLDRDITAQLAPYHDDRPFALLDFPDHPNVGDSAIWLGELAYFGKLGKSPSYVCVKNDVDWDRLAKAVPDGPIYIHGGGNFGDIWPEHQDFRLEVLRRFPGRLVIQLPQSIHFSTERDIARTQSAIAAHGNFVLLVRDQESLELSKTHFDCKTNLCPDMAFALGAEPKRATPRYDELFLLRTDLERVDWGAQHEAPNTIVADWLDERRGIHPRTKIETLLHGIFGGLIARPAIFPQLYFERLARNRVERGLRQLSSARHVTTDRLHAHILSTLLNVPHTVRDNSYGKISRFMAAWDTRWNGVTVQAQKIQHAQASGGTMVTSLSP